MADWFGKEVFKLGFGLMRLPKMADGSIDIPQVSEMVDRFLEAGGTYFDTAYVYDEGKSEEAARLALVERYPRDRYTLCTKLNARAAKNEAEAKRQFEISLERTGAGYFDAHPYKALLEENFAKADPDWDKKPDIKWNFTKFVVDREGTVVARFEPTADIDKVEACIKTLL